MFTPPVFRNKVQSLTLTRKWWHKLKAYVLTEGWRAAWSRIRRGSSIYFVVWFRACDVKSYRVITLHSATAVRMFKMTSLLAPTPSSCSCHPRKWKRSVPTVSARQLNEAETTYLCISRIRNSATSSVDLLANISHNMHYIFGGFTG
jgi:hypothetical protein